jgi:dihydroneopterin aldolase
MKDHDLIVIDSLELVACIGVPAEERAAPQRLTATLTLEPLRDFRALDDRIENTVDYFAVGEFVKQLGAANSRQLLETLAGDICAQLLARFPLRAVEIELRKYILRETAFVAVRLRRDSGVGAGPVDSLPQRR